MKGKRIDFDPEDVDDLEVGDQLHLVKDTGQKYDAKYSQPLKKYRVVSVKLEKVDPVTQPEREEDIKGQVQVISEEAWEETRRKSK